jgi:hypothetical protein
MSMDDLDVQDHGLAYLDEQEPVENSCGPQPAPRLGPLLSQGSPWTGAPHRPAGVAGTYPVVRDGTVTGGRGERASQDRREEIARRMRGTGRGTHAPGVYPWVPGATWQRALLDLGGALDGESTDQDLDQRTTVAGEGVAGRPDVFDFESFSTYCLAYYEWWRAQRPKVRSWAWLAQRLGLPQRDRNYLRNICTGARPMPDSLIEPLAEAFNLDEAEKTYFRTLIALSRVSDKDVARNRARLEQNPDDDETVERLDRLLRLEEDLRADLQALKRIRAGEGTAAPGFLARWWYVVVREMAFQENFRADPHWIARRVWPKITPDDAADALEFLVEHDLLTFDEETLEVIHVDERPIVQNSDGSLRQYHWDFGAIAAQSMELPANERFFGGLTITVAEDRVAELRGVLRACGMEIMRRFQGSRSGRVMHVAFRSFPVTLPPDEP